METGKNIAIIHKDKGVVETLALMAQTLGYIPHTMIVNKATTPQQVASFVAQVDPDLVLLAENYQYGQFVPDPQSRGEKIGEGIEALAEIKRSGHSKPIHMVSGGTLYHKRAKQEGASGYLQIPVTYEEFRQFLKTSTQS